MSLISLEILTYSLILWLGFYLINRNSSDLRLRFTGLGLIAYALNLATDLIILYYPTPTLLRLHWSLLLLPTIFWLIAMIQLMPEPQRLQLPFAKAGQIGLWTITPTFYLLSISTNLIFDVRGAVIQPGIVYWLFVTLMFTPMVIALFMILRITINQPQTSYGLILLATLFLGLGIGAILFPFNSLPRSWFLIGVSADFLIFGLAIAWLDAFDEGETFLPDFLRSLTGTGFMVLIFGGLVVLTIGLSVGLTFPMLMLLLAIISMTIITQVFIDSIQTLLDRFVFAPSTKLRQARANLRTAASVLPRINETPTFEITNEKEFTRLTRRALSHLGNMPKLATSPLTRLPQITNRLTKRKASDDTLERATELKILLTDSIHRLKPPADTLFGTTDEWRYYNALYFPYVIGLKPYSQRADHTGLDPVNQQALEWFQTYIPQRTLYNWQNAGAKLIAQDLLEQLNH